MDQTAAIIAIASYNSSRGKTHRRQSRVIDGGCQIIQLLLCLACLFIHTRTIAKSSDADRVIAFFWNSSKAISPDN